MNQFSHPRKRRGPPSRDTTVALTAPSALGPGVVAVFGMPGTGVSTVVRCLVGAAKTPAHVAQTLSDAPRTGLVFLDGVPLDADDVQQLYNQRFVFPGRGVIVQMMTDPELLVRAGRTTVEGVESFYATLKDIEEKIRVLGLHRQYFSIRNEPGEEGLAVAVGDLARRAGVRS